MRLNVKALVAACALSLAACGGGAGSQNTSTMAANEGARPGGSGSPAASGSPSSSSSTVVTSGGASKGPSADVVRASAEALELSAGGRAEASVRLHIAPGYHINANPPTHDFLIPTQLELTPEPGVTAGKPAYPPPLKKKFAFDPQPLAVYESEAVIKVPLSVAASAQKGERALRAKVRVQPCDDNACYPPRNVETTLALTVK